MTAELIIAYFERFADTPDATNRLRRLVLDLAVRGKLVQQDPAEEPATALLERIKAEKSRLVETGELRRQRTLPRIEPDEAPYDLPHNWRWVRIREVTSDRGQLVPDRDFTYIDVTAINKEIGRIEDARVLSPAEAPSRARKIVQKGDVIYSCVRPYLLNIAVVEDELCPSPIASTAFAVMNGLGLILPRYQWLVLRSSYFIECVEKSMRGQAYPAISEREFASLPFPLPPLAEQHRIVAKVDELMALCDRIEAARAEREATRDRLTAASLARLSNTDPATFRDDARFVLEALPQLASRPDQIKVIRQTILDLGVRGKLAPQDPTDEPAAEALKRIAAERATLSGKRIGKRKSELDSPLLPNLPETWEWTTLKDILAKPLSNGRSVPDSLHGFPVLRLNAIRGRTVDTAQRKLGQWTEAEASPFLIEPGDFLVARGNGSLKLVGRGALVDCEPEAIAYPDTMIRIRPHSGVISAHFLAIVWDSKQIRVYIEEAARTTTGIYKINQRALESLYLPLPPIAEQRRIVTKVDELMALCDQLEAILIDAADTRSRLLDAFITEALNPDSVKHIEMSPDHVTCNNSVPHPVFAKDQDETACFARSRTV